MTLKKTRDKYIKKYIEARANYKDVFPEVIWEGFVVHLMVRDFETALSEAREMVTIKTDLAKALVTRIEELEKARKG